MQLLYLNLETKFHKYGAIHFIFHKFLKISRRRLNTPVKSSEKWYVATEAASQATDRDLEMKILQHLSDEFWVDLLN